MPPLMRDFFCKLLLSFLFLLSCGCSLAKESSQLIEFPPRFINFSTENGLTFPTVTAFAQDDKGFMWVGTSKGLNRFDGRTFHPYLQDGNKQLSDPFVQVLLFDSKGWLWIGTVKGLNRFNPNTGQLQIFYKAEDGLKGGLSSNSIGKIVEDNDGNIWIASPGGLDVFWQESSTIVNISGFTKGAWWQKKKRIHGLAVSKDNKVLIGLNDGSLIGYQINAKQFELIIAAKQHQLLTNNKDYWLNLFYFEPTSEQIWFGSWGSGVSVYDIKTQQFFYGFSNNKRAVLSIAADKQQRIWIGRDDNTIQIFNSNRELVEQITAEPYLTESFQFGARRLFKDAQGQMWVGTHDSGVLYQDTLHSSTGWIKPATSEQSSNVWSLYEDAQGNIWAGGSEGLWLMEPHWPYKVKAYLAVEGIVTSMQQIASQDFIITTTKGVFLVDTTNLSQLEYRAVQGLPKKMFFASMIIGERLFVIGDSGLYVASQKKPNKFEFMTLFENDAPLKASRHFCMTKDAQDFLWLCGRGDIWQVDVNTGKLIKRVKFDQHFDTGVKLNLLTYDKDNKLFISTNSGLIIYDIQSTQVKVINDKHGLPSNLLYTTQALDNQLWFSGARGIYQYDRVKGKFIEWYTIEDGLSGGGFSSAMILTRDRCLMYGGANGISHVCPEQLPQRAQISSPQLSGLTVNYQLQDNISRWTEQPLGDVTSLYFGHLDKQVGFTFLTVSHPHNPRLSFQYRLKGFDDGWVNVDAYPANAYYTSLPPGQYQLELKVYDSLYPSDAKLRNIAVNVAYPPWQSPLAYLLYLLIVVVLVVALFVYRHKRAVKYAQELRAEVARQTEVIKEKHIQTQELLEEKNAMLAVISHEMKTPLTVIKGGASQLGESPLTKEQKQLLNLIGNNTQRLKRFIKEILLTAKLKQKQHFEFKTVPFSALVRATLENLSVIGKSHGHNIRSYIDCEIEVNGSAKELELMVSNLIKNAIVHGGQHCDIELRLSIDDGRAYLIVSDTGKGMDKETLAVAFEAFVSRSSSTVEFGSGLGLSLIKDIVELHQGQIEIESEVGKGTVVSVILPQAVECKRQIKYEVDADNKVIESVENGELPQVFNRPRMLIVDDEPDILVLLQLRFAEDYQLRFAANGVEALAQIKQDKPDIVLVDLMMPQLDGMGMIKKLRLTEEYRDLPVIMLSASAQMTNQVKGLKQGADAFLEKPFDYELLEAQIERLLVKQSVKQHQISVVEQKHLNEVTEQPVSKEVEFRHLMEEKIEKFYADAEFGVKQLSSEFAMSERNFRRKCKDSLGMTPLNFIFEIRCEKAKLLLSSDYSIEDIAEHCGFQSGAQMRRWFSVVYDKTPSELR